MQILYLRLLAAAMTRSAKPAVVLNFLSPGFCISDITKEQMHLGVRIARKVVARSTEEGSRSLVASVVREGAEKTHGEYMFDGVVARCVTFRFCYYFSTSLVWFMKDNNRRKPKPKLTTLLIQYLPLRPLKGRRNRRQEGLGRAQRDARNHRARRRCEYLNFFGRNLNVFLKLQI